jgi:hypothetical protein
MNKRIALLISIVLIGQFLIAQNKLPIIKATSQMVDIRDGETFQKAGWRISPKLKPDVYTSSNINKKIVFYTDIDSISFKINPNKSFGFIILLNDKDSAYTLVKYKPGHLEILKNARKYNFSDNRPINKFSYKTAESSDLISLKNKFKLDSIAGTGNEVSKLINLLFWVHNTFPYDGSKEVPQYKNIEDLMTTCIKDHGTMHCGALTWVLKECYFAMGFKARQVVCLPKDSNDFECHSIISVYSNTLKKWLWMDPTNCAYVMDKNRNLLSIAEVRDYLTSNKPLILNSEANANQSPVIIEDYLYRYMAKNLYAFQCYSEKDGESTSNLLLPLEYKGIFPRTKANRPKYTNNPNKFWSKPED